ncbi:MAG: hypothetical protein AB7T59_10250 [Hyphomonadaceae bacterium]
MSTDDKLAVLKDMIALIGESVLEGEQRQRFAALVAQFDALAAKPKTTKRQPKPFDGAVPDVRAELAARQRADFIAWASALDLRLLKHIIKTEQLDPSGRSKSWRKAERFAELIHDQLTLRNERGSAFGRVAGGE